MERHGLKMVEVSVDIMTNVTDCDAEESVVGAHDHIVFRCSNYAMY
jgi:hypothetical protein